MSPSSPERRLATRPADARLTHAVLSGSHDPALNPPPGIPEPAWSRFPADDQKAIIALAIRFGQWTPDSGRRQIAELRQTLPSAGLSAVRDALAGHYDAAQDWASQIGQLDARGLVAGVGSDHRDALSVFLKTAREIAQWDMYWRALAPDVIVFHGGMTGGSAPDRRAQIARCHEFYSGYSWTPHLNCARRYGPVITATVLPIALITLNWNVPIDPQHDQTHGSEHEIASDSWLTLDALQSTAFGAEDAFEGGDEAWRHLCATFAEPNIHGGGMWGEIARAASG